MELWARERNEKKFEERNSLGLNKKLSASLNKGRLKA